MITVILFPYSCFQFTFSFNLFQAQKAKEKEEHEHLMHELDKNFTSLVQSEALLSLTEPGKMNALKALVNKSILNEQRKKDEPFTSQKNENLNKVLCSDECSRWQTFNQ